MLLTATVAPARSYLDIIDWQAPAHLLSPSTDSASPSSSLLQQHHDSLLQQKHSLSQQVQFLSAPQDWTLPEEYADRLESERDVEMWRKKESGRKDGRAAANTSNENQLLGRLEPISYSSIYHPLQQQQHHNEEEKEQSIPHRSRRNARPRHTTAAQAALAAESLYATSIRNLRAAAVPSSLSAGSLAGYDGDQIVEDHSSSHYNPSIYPTPSHLHSSPPPAQLAQHISYSTITSVLSTMTDDLDELEQRVAELRQEHVPRSHQEIAAYQDRLRERRRYVLSSQLKKTDRLQIQTAQQTKNAKETMRRIEEVMRGRPKVMRRGNERVEEEKENQQPQHLSEHQLHQQASQFRMSSSSHLHHHQHSQLNPYDHIISPEASFAEYEEQSESRQHQEQQSQSLLENDEAAEPTYESDVEEQGNAAAAADESAEIIRADDASTVTEDAALDQLVKPSPSGPSEPAVSPAAAVGASSLSSSSPYRRHPSTSYPKPWQQQPRHASKKSIPAPTTRKQPAGPPRAQIALENELDAALRDAQSLIGNLMKQIT